jgi:serine/threonine-protein kinase RsbW
VHTVELAVAPLTAHVRTARLVAVSFARRTTLEEDVLDELRLAVGEASSRAVALHRHHNLIDPVRLSFALADGRLVIEVTDCAPSGDDAGQDLEQATPALFSEHADDSELPAAVGLAVLAGLVDDLTVTGSGTGTVVRMAWPVAVAAPVAAG